MPSVDKVAFTLFGIEVNWYGILIVFGMILALIAAIILGKRRGISAENILLLAIIMLPCAILGTRAFFVIEKRLPITQFFDFKDGGLAIYGGVIAGIIGGIIYCLVTKTKGKDILKILDILAVVVLIGQSVGRWGNFVNMEAFGQEITNPEYQFFPYGVYVECFSDTCNCAGGWGWHQATFFYESIWNLIGFIGMFAFCWNFDKIYGLQVCGYFVYYGIARTWIEGLRTDSLYFMEDVLGKTIRTSQMISIILVVVGIVFGAILIARYYKKKKSSNEGKTDQNNLGGNIKEVSR